MLDDYQDKTCYFLKLSSILTQLNIVMKQNRHIFFINKYQTIKLSRGIYKIKLHYRFECIFLGETMAKIVEELQVKLLCYRLISEQYD